MKPDPAALRFAGTAASECTPWFAIALRSESRDMGGRPSVKDPPEGSRGASILGVEAPLCGGVLRPSLAVDCSLRSWTVILTRSTACITASASMC